MINYSFIIPHKNSPEVLIRCVDSIPKRDDVQIIVVDDNSDEGKLPTLTKRKGLEIVLLNASQSKGAGRARNVGLEKAKGKWLLFADSDDFFPPGFLLIFDEYKDSDYEVIYFNSKYVVSNTLQPLRKPKSLIDIGKYDGTQEMRNKVRFMNHVPWAKMVKRYFVQSNNVMFEEISKGNDTFFSYQLGYYGKKVTVDKRVVYVYTMTADSITNRKKEWQVYRQSFINYYKNKAFHTFIGHPEFSISLFRMFCVFFKRESTFNMLKIIYMYIKDYHIIHKDKNRYVEYFCKHPNKI